MNEQVPILTLHLLPELKEGGLERGVVEKVIWLKKHGVNSVVVSAGGIWLDRLTSAGIDHIDLPVNNKNPFSVLSCSIKLKKIIADEKVQLVCAHSRAPAWVAHLATRQRGKHNPPLVIEAQGYYEHYLTSNVMIWAEKTISVSSAIRSDLIKYFHADPSKLVVIPRGIDPEQFKPPSPGARSRIRNEWNIPDDAPLIVGVGRLTHTKGWDDLVNAIAGMRKHSPFLLLVGSAHPRRRKFVTRLEGLIKSHGLIGRVKFTGHREDLPDFYAASDCVAVPSRLPEPFGRVVIEALTYKRPVITTEGCGAIEFLGDEINPFLAPPGDSDKIMERLEWVLDEPSLVARLVETIASRIKTELTVDRQLWETIDVYRSCRPDLSWPSA